jgi:putative transposase
MLILNERHLEKVLAIFVDHYNVHRPHRALALTPPHPTRPGVAPPALSGRFEVQRRDRLAGVIREYVLAA